MNPLFTTNKETCFNMESAISNLTIFPLTNTGKSDFITKTKAAILSGDVDPLKIDATLKMIEDICGALRKDADIKRAVHDTADRYEKSFKIHGVSFTRSERKTYLYESCNDSTYTVLLSQMEDLKAKIKARETFLQSLPEEGTVNPDTGELINRPNCIVTPVLTIKFE